MSSGSVIKGRVSEKKLAELKEIISLQNQEIFRLKSEQENLIEQINDSEIRNSKTETILMKRIASLQSEIANYRSKVSILRSHSSILHSKRMNEQQEIHQNNIMRMRTDYEIKISELKVKNTAKTDETTNIFSQIDGTCQEISNVLNEKIKKNENEVQKQLLSLREKIESLRSDEICLREQIEKRREVIKSEDDKFKKYIEKSKKLQKKKELVINETIESANERYNIFDNTQTIEENSLRDHYDKQLEDLRLKVSKMSNKVTLMKDSIKTGRTPESDMIDEQKQEKARISKELDSKIIEHDESGDSGILKKIKEEYSDRKYLIGRIKAYRKQMDTLKEEKKGILMELKRIDFMVFGRNGKYQKIAEKI